MKHEKLEGRIKGKKAIPIEGQLKSAISISIKQGKKKRKFEYPSNSYISIGFSGQGPIFDVPFTLEPVKYSYPINN